MWPNQGSRAVSAAVHVQFPETMEEGTMRPKIGGLSDPRLGTIDRCAPSSFACSKPCQSSSRLIHAPNTETSSARPVAKASQPAPVTLVTLSLPSLCIILVCLPLAALSRFRSHSALAGFLNKIKKILECVCVSCGKLKVDLSCASPLGQLAVRSCLMICVCLLGTPSFAKWSPTSRTPRSALLPCMRLLGSVSP